jgi:hypothetical protein
MNQEQEEVTRFKIALQKSSLEHIRQGLDDFVIVRGWKRKLAQEESARRQHNQDTNAASDLNARRFQAGFVWVILLFLSLAAVLAIGMTVLGYWRF